ncbi:MAG: Nicotinate-nucleotide adenylyltransferase [uncultured Chthoniobacterales bacterium]|uniref:Probable nicotinate-nucleotide adenylyltransferase n=1 Tax=uncultured Chthoniobacterales bacterium TaxID=1836801 RepID=A0A6J4H7B4_9BACT|nr:MAG: Nicotinate-nucleotide adenylyltransferase [uncultured Chthoniobacterales bacterium]
MTLVSKLGIYGGTFDPIHNGHLILAREAREQLQLDRLIFVPAAASPHKLERAATSAAVRLEMLRAGVEGESGFEVNDVELRRSPPSFTVDTIEDVRRSNPQSEVFYLVGADNLPRLQTWHRFHDLQKLVQFVVLARGAEPIDDCYTTIRRLIDVSATDIRNRVATGRSIRYLVPAAVEEIIQRQQLYKEPAKSHPKN